MSALKEDLESILHEVATSLGITKYELVLDLNPIIGDGFVGQFFTEKIKDIENGQVTEVAVKKIPPKRNDLGVMFKNEQIFYSVIYPALNRFQMERGISKPFTNMPVYFCGSSQPGKEYIAMENLKSRGFILLEKTIPLDEKHLERLFEVYGRFHALSFVFEKENARECTELLKDVKTIYETYSKEDIAGPIKSSFAGAVDALDRESDGELFEKSTKLINDIGNDFLRSINYEGKYSCINHGDCWSNNILFAYNELGNIEDVKIVDFQLCRRTTPVHDLSYLLYSGGSEEDFHKVLNYLRIYHDSFSKFTSSFGFEGEELLPFKELVAEWKENALFGVLMAIYVWQYKLYQKDKVTEILGNYDMSPEEKGAKWAILKKEVNKSDIFKKATKILLKHLINENFVLALSKN